MPARRSAPSHVLFKKFRNGIEHLRQSAGLLAHGDHLCRQVGKYAGLVSESARLLAFAHRADGRSNTAFETLRDEIERAAVSSDGTSGNPPVSSVESVRENNATWYLSQILPKTGTPTRMPVHDVAALLGDRKTVDCRRAITSNASGDPHECCAASIFRMSSRASGHLRAAWSPSGHRARQTAESPR